MGAPLSENVLRDLAHEQMIHTTYDIVSQRHQLEPVRAFFVEDLCTNSGSATIAEHGSPDSEDEISIILGEPPTSFRAETTRICALSDYLNRAITSRLAGQPPIPEAGKLTLCMLDEDPLSFEIILNWTITNTFSDPKTEDPYFYTRLLDAYFLADRLEMRATCHAILAELDERAPPGLMDCHGFIYTNTTPSSPLRRLLVRMAVNDPRVEGVVQKGPGYGLHNPYFLLDLKNELVEKVKSQQPPNPSLDPNISGNEAGAG